MRRVAQKLNLYKIFRFNIYRLVIAIYPYTVVCAILFLSALPLNIGVDVFNSLSVYYLFQ